MISIRYNVLSRSFGGKRSPGAILAKTLFSFLSGFAALQLIASTAVAADRGPPFTLPPRAELSKLRTAVISTSKGDLTLELYPEEAPWHVANFKYLADKGYYRNMPFHLYYQDYLIQAGDPTGTGKGGVPYGLPPEFTNRNHVPGTLGMARAADSVNPERRSHGSQFHLLLSEARHMNGLYTVFGKVTQGMDTLFELRKGDVINDIKVFVRDSSSQYQPRANDRDPQPRVASPTRPPPFEHLRGDYDR